MSNLSPRMYQVLWWQIKEEKDVTIQLQPPSMSESQTLRSFKTMKKAVQKEKYLDFEFRNTYPSATVNAELLIAKRRVRFVLNLKHYTTEMFEM